MDIWQGGRSGVGSSRLLEAAEEKDFCEPPQLKGIKPLPGKADQISHNTEEGEGKSKCRVLKKRALIWKLGGGTEGCPDAAKRNWSPTSLM